MNTNTIVVGQTTTCQFGNPSDTDWTDETHANVEVKVIAVKEGIVSKLYLVQTDGKLGVATVSYADHIQGVLCCTCALPYGAEKYVKTPEEAASRLGFENVQF